MSKREEVLQALYERLLALSEIVVRRNEVLPLKIPSGGLVGLRDGNVGEPLVLLSPLLYLFQHRAEIEVLTQKVNPADSDSALDMLLEKIGHLIMVDPTLSGKIDYMHAEPPEFAEQPIDGGITIKAATVPIVLEYVSDSNLT